MLIVPHPKRRRAEQVTNAARVRVAWSSAPGPDEIRARDRERLLEDAMFAEPGDAERAEAEALLAGHSPVVVAAALLLHVANVDGKIDQVERTRLRDVIEKQFGLDAAVASR